MAMYFSMLIMCCMKLWLRKAEELRDKRFNELRPLPRQEWRPKPMKVEKSMINQDDEDDNEGEGSLVISNN